VYDTLPFTSVSASNMEVRNGRIRLVLVRLGHVEFSYVIYILKKKYRKNWVDRRASKSPERNTYLVPVTYFENTKWLFAHLPHIKCIKLGSVRSSHLPFKMHYVRSSLHVFSPTGE